MVRNLEIVKLGNPVLCMVARPVVDISEMIVQDLIDNMVETLAQFPKGIGLAAPQVGASLRVIVVKIPDDGYVPKVNPVNEKLSSDLRIFWEQCLSVPGIRGLVPRSRTVRVSFTDRKGGKIEREFEEIRSVLMQHEIDHLEGILYLDRLDPDLAVGRSLISEEEYQIQKLMNSEIVYR